MTLQQLEYIVALNSHRHFANAAEACGVTQPTLSAQIHKLEDELQVKIFNRSSHPLTPTAIGEKIIGEAKHTLAHAKHIKELVSENTQSITGIFRLGILPTIAPYLLPRFLPQFMANYPELELKIYELKTEEIKTQLTNEELDAGILACLGESDEFIRTSLYFEQYMLYVANENKLSDQKFIRPSELTNQHIWLLDEGHCFRDQILKFCCLTPSKSIAQKNISCNTTYSLGSIETFMRLVESGQGITFLPELALSQLSEHQRLLVRPFSIPIPTREVVLMTTNTFVRESIKELITKTIRECVPQTMLRLNNSEQRI